MVSCTVSTSSAYDRIGHDLLYISREGILDSKQYCHESPGLLLVSLPSYYNTLPNMALGNSCLLG